MVKRISLTTFSALFISIVYSQVDCSNGRYFEEIFTEVSVTSNLVYGKNPNGANIDLLMDIYQPVGDTETQRPLIIFAHGGSFVGGSKTENTATTVCTRFAKMGFVTASITYTINSPIPVNVPTGVRAVINATHDMKAAIRYMRKSYTEGNPYKINPNIVIVGGNSAGGFMALHAAYMDKAEEVPGGIDINLYGGIEGQSGNLGYSSKVSLVMNFAGAIGDTTMMEAGDVPVVSMHGDQDMVVPFNRALIVALSIFPIMEVCGSLAIHEKATGLGIPSELKVYPGAGHVPWENNAADMQSAVNFAKDFVHDQLCNGNLGTNEVALKKTDFLMFPNPTNNFLNIISEEMDKFYKIEILDISGRIVKSTNLNNSSIVQVETGDLRNGQYLVRLVGKNTIGTQKLIVSR